MPKVPHEVVRTCHAWSTGHDFPDSTYDRQSRRPGSGNLCRSTAIGGMVRTKTSAAALCLILGAAISGCSVTDDGADTRSADDTRTADQLLGDATRTMRALTSLTIDMQVGSEGKTLYSSRFTTDLKRRCTLKATWSRRGAALEQIRIGETDYIHPGGTYLEMWGRKTVPAMRQKPWLKSPVSAALGADNLVDCAWQFPSYKGATKGDQTELDGKPAIPVKVKDDEISGGMYTFYVATEGKPYILRIDHQEPPYLRITKFSGFNNRFAIQPPAAVDVLDLSKLPSDAP
ncbi:hypothetical protein [Streptomyces sp. NPDC001635]